MKVTEVTIETGIPNYTFLIQKAGDKLNVVMKRDMLSFSMVVNATDFQSAINALIITDNMENEHV